MFRRLRDKFMLLNLVIISVMMLIAFVTIYTITYRDVRADIGMEMKRIADFYGKDASGLRDRGPAGERGWPGGGGDGGPRRFPVDQEGQPAQDRSVSFAIATDPAWARASVTSVFTMDDAFYEAALQAARTEGKASGQIRLDGYDWAYEIHDQPYGYRLVFLDVTARQAILTNLVYTFLAVGALMLVVIFFISRLFADRAIAPVKEAFEKQKQFIADASHELKTPLAVIGTNADALLANERDTVRNQARWVRHIQAETERMTKLTNDLLYLTRMEDARDETLLAPFSASDAAESVALAMEAVVYERKLKLDYAIEPGVSVLGSAEQFKQVVMILLDKAVKYANPEGAIRVRLKRQHHDMVLTVANTGEGIAPEHLNRIFDRFYRTDPSRTRARGGYGLGLAIAKAIVERHKGKIYAKSVMGDTTTFAVHLPLAAQKQA